MPFWMPSAQVVFAGAPPPPVEVDDEDELVVDEDELVVDEDELVVDEDELALDEDELAPDPPPPDAPPVPRTPPVLSKHDESIHASPPHAPRVEVRTSIPRC
jgi:hypothetical protein